MKKTRESQYRETEGADSSWMSLCEEVLSEDCIKLVLNLSEKVYSVQKRKRNLTSKLITTVGCILADLMRSRERDDRGYSYRSVGSDDFEGSPVGRKAFLDTINAMRELGYVEWERGFKTSTGTGAEAQASRFWITPALLSLAEAHGITPANWRSHFRQRKAPAMVRRPLLLRASSSRKYGAFGPKSLGRLMPIDYTNPKNLTTRENVNFINAYVAQQKLENCPFLGFRIIYSRGDVPGHNYECGGRMYPVGGGYQSMRNKEGQRSLIRINGEETAEVDVSNSHLNIVRFRASIPFDPNVDAYAIGAYKDNRGPMKVFVNLCIGAGKVIKRWPKKLSEKDRITVKGHKVKDLSAEALRFYPFLNDKKVMLPWWELQYRESEPVIASVIRLAKEFDIPALPVHDSLIVPASKRELAAKVLAESFEKYLGFRPKIKSNEPSVGT